jgi:hypothetical protein
MDWDGLIWAAIEGKWHVVVLANVRAPYLVLPITYDAITITTYNYADPLILSYELFS